MLPSYSDGSNIAATSLHDQDDCSPGRSCNALPCIAFTPLRRQRTRSTCTPEPRLDHQANPSKCTFGCMCRPLIRLCSKPSALPQSSCCLTRPIVMSTVLPLPPLRLFFFSRNAGSCLSTPMITIQIKYWGYSSSQDRVPRSSRGSAHWAVGVPEVGLTTALYLCRCRCLVALCSSHGSRHSFGTLRNSGVTTAALGSGGA